MANELLLWAKHSLSAVHKLPRVIHTEILWRAYDSFPHFNNVETESWGG